MRDKNFNIPNLSLRELILNFAQNVPDGNIIISNNRKNGNLAVNIRDSKQNLISQFEISISRESKIYVNYHPFYDKSKILDGRESPRLKQGHLDSPEGFLPGASVVHPTIPPEIPIKKRKRRRKIEAELALHESRMRKWGVIPDKIKPTGVYRESRFVSVLGFCTSCGRKIFGYTEVTYRNSNGEIYLQRKTCKICAEKNYYPYYGNPHELED